MQLHEIESSLTTRGYEVAADGLIHPAVWLRYAEQLRWEAIAVAPELADLFGTDQRLAIVAQRLDLRRGLPWGVSLLGRFSICQLGRTSLDFLHRFFVDGEEVAAVWARAVFLGPTWRPQALPEVFRAAVVLSGEPTSFAHLEGDPPAEAKELAVTVRPSDIDFLNHVNHSNYLSYFDDARQRLVTNGVQRLATAEIAYLEQAYVGDELKVKLWWQDDLCCGVLNDSKGVPRARAQLQLVELKDSQ